MIKVCHSSLSSSLKVFCNAFYSHASLSSSLKYFVMPFIHGAEMTLSYIESLVRA